MGEQFHFTKRNKISANISRNIGQLVEKFGAKLVSCTELPQSKIEWTVFKILKNVIVDERTTKICPPNLSKINKKCI